MVSATLDAAHLDRLDDHPDPLSQITIVDPACGCGIFPVYVARHLAAWYAAWLVGPNPPTGVITTVMPLVMHNCVYGIDLDPRSEERRVGKECRSRGATSHQREKREGTQTRGAERRQHT